MPLYSDSEPCTYAFKYRLNLVEPGLSQIPNCDCATKVGLGSYSECKETFNA